ELAAGRVGLAVGLGPAVARKELAGGRIDVVLPGREDPHVSPLEDARTDRRTGLEDDGLRATLQELGGGCEADRPPTDDRDGQCFHGPHDAHLSTLVNIEVCGYSARH